MTSYTGTLYDTNVSGQVEILSEPINGKVEVRFLNTGYTTTAYLSNIRAGTIRDKLMPTVYGVGVFGTKYPAKLNGVIQKEYSLWTDMLKRCYDAKEHYRYPNYIGCSVSENFKSYEYFYEWCQKQVGFGNPGWHLDKDLLVKGNKVYSEDTCVFLPPELNTVLTTAGSIRGQLPIGVQLSKSGNYISSYNLGGVHFHGGTFYSVEEAFVHYKQAKEQYLQHLAYKWKGYIDHRAYYALLYYSVEITDQLIKFEIAVQYINYDYINEYPVV